MKLPFSPWWWNIPLNGSSNANRQTSTTNKLKLTPTISDAKLNTGWAAGYLVDGQWHGTERHMALKTTFGTRHLSTEIDPKQSQSFLSIALWSWTSRIEKPLSSTDPIFWTFKIFHTAKLPYKMKCNLQSIGHEMLKTRNFQFMAQPSRSCKTRSFLEPKCNMCQRDCIRMSHGRSDLAFEFRFQLCFCHKTARVGIRTYVT